MYVTKDTAAKIIQEQKNQGKTFAMVSGCHDLLHYGHLAYFRFAKRQADYLLVAVENDESIKRSKGKDRPIMKLAERGEMLSDIQSIDLIVPVDEVYAFQDNDAPIIHYDLTKQLGIDVLVTHSVGDEYCREKRERAQNLGISFAASNEYSEITTNNRHY